MLDKSVRLLKIPIKNLLLKFAIKAVTLSGRKVIERDLQELYQTEKSVEYFWVLRNLDLDHPGRILDVGIGTSCFTDLLSHQGLSIYAIDVFEWPHARTSNFKFIQGDVREVKLPKKFFDRIILISTIEHIGLDPRAAKEEDGDIRAIKNLIPSLKPDGKILFTFPYWKKHLIYADSRIYDDERIKRVFGIPGFKIVKKEIFVKKDGGWFPGSKKDVEKIVYQIPPVKPLHPGNSISV